MRALKLCAMLALAFVVGCSSKSPTSTSSATGNLVITISGLTSSTSSGSLRQAIGHTSPPNAAAQVKSIVLTHTGPDGGGTQTITNLTSPITANYDALPVGGYTFSAIAYDGSTPPVELFASASVPVNVVAKTVSALNLILQQVVPPGTVTPVAPEITSIAVSNANPGASSIISLTASVSAPVPANQLSYAWTSSCSASEAGTAGDSFSNPSSLSTNFTSYCTGVETLTFTVTETSSAGGLMAAVSFTIPYASEGTNVTLSFHSLPDITSLTTAGNAQPPLGGTVALVATVHDNVSGDTPTLSWKDNCNGSWLNGTTLVPTWTAPSSAPNGATTPFACTLTLTVTDGQGGTNSGWLIVSVGEPTLLAPPVAPTGVAATPGVGQMTITWNAVSGASSYNLYWSSSSGVTPANGTEIANVTSPYVQTGLSFGTTYYYVVTAVDSAGESLPSSPASATTPATPAAPTGVAATPGLNQMSISWNAVSGATSYNIYWSTTSGVTTANGTKIAGATSPYVQTGLANGTSYFYVVTAVDGAGESAASLQATGVTPSLAAAPTGVLAAGGSQEVTISWNAVTGATSYNIYWSTTNGVTPANGIKIANATSPYVQSGLTSSTTYYYVVTAVGSVGESSPSGQVSATPVQTQAVITTEIIGQIGSTGGGGNGASTSDMIIDMYTGYEGWAGGAGAVQGPMAWTNLGTTTGSSTSGTGPSDEALNFPIASQVAALNATYGAGNWTVTGGRLTLQSAYSSQNNSRFGYGAGTYQVYWVEPNSWTANESLATTNPPFTNPIYATTQAQLNTWAGSSSLLAYADFACPVCPTGGSNSANAYTTVNIPLTDTAALNTAVASLATGSVPATIPDLSLYLMQTSPDVGMIIYTGGQNQILAYITLDVAITLPQVPQTGGNVVPTSTWSSSTAVEIGNTSNGTLNLTGGTALTAGVTELGVASGVFGELYVNGSGTTFTDTNLSVGYNGTGFVSITNGGTVTSTGSAGSVDAIGAYGSGGMVVSGTGSTYTSSAILDLGEYGTLNSIYSLGSNGILTVTNGGVVNDSNAINIGYAAGFPGSTSIEAAGNGTVNVDGAGSAIKGGTGTLTVGNNGFGKLAVTNGAQVSTGVTNIGVARESAGKVNVDGTGSAFAAATSISLGSSGVPWDMNGSLAVTDGASVTTPALTLYASGTETLTVDTNSSVHVSGAISTANTSGYGYTGSAVATNATTIALVAGIDAAAGTYTPLVAGSVSKAVGTIEALGGVLNSSYQIVVNGAAAGVGGSGVTVDPSVTQRIVTTDSGSGQEVGVGLMGTTTSGTSVTVTATIADSADLTALSTALSSGKNIDGAWTVSFNSGYSSPFYLSLYVGKGRTLTGLSVYQNLGSGWALASGITDLAYDGTYASFTAPAAGEYAIVETPASAL